MKLLSLLHFGIGRRQPSLPFCFALAPPFSVFFIHANCLLLSRVWCSRDSFVILGMILEPFCNVFVPTLQTVCARLKINVLQRSRRLQRPFLGGSKTWIHFPLMGQFPRQLLISGTLRPAFFLHFRWRLGGFR
ncbi:MAG: hypothetical protein M2R45_03591 [Verrucomicrobia subdivision 3 bacterium]|nr:hypothetical protein [Limisphaerales bacterium]MCS1414776.1 hypothetical protein [Limisphaerales bacterium]